MSILSPACLHWAPLRSWRGSSVWLSPFFFKIVLPKFMIFYALLECVSIDKLWVPPLSPRLRRPCQALPPIPDGPSLACWSLSCLIASRTRHAFSILHNAIWSGASCLCSTTPSTHRHSKSPTVQCCLPPTLPLAAPCSASYIIAQLWFTGMYHFLRQSCNTQACDIAVGGLLFPMP